MKLSKPSTQQKGENESSKTSNIVTSVSKPTRLLVDKEKLTTFIGKRIAAKKKILQKIFGRYQKAASTNPN